MALAASGMALANALHVQGLVGVALRVLEMRLCVAHKRSKFYLLCSQCPVSKGSIVGLNKVMTIRTHDKELSCQPMGCRRPFFGRAQRSRPDC